MEEFCLRFCNKNFNGDVVAKWCLDSIGEGHIRRLFKSLLPVGLILPELPILLALLDLAEVDALQDKMHCLHLASQ